MVQVREDLDVHTRAEGTIQDSCERGMGRRLAAYQTDPRDAVVGCLVNDAQPVLSGYHAVAPVWPGVGIAVQTVELASSSEF